MERYFDWDIGRFESKIKIEVRIFPCIWVETKMANLKNSFENSSTTIILNFTNEVRSSQESDKILKELTISMGWRKEWKGETED